MTSTSISVKTILFVENDPVALTLYQKRLEREGFHIECAQDGRAALDILSDHTPDLVLLDLMIPKVSGADVLKFMHADPRLTNIPVIIFSNAPMTEVPPDSPLAQGTKRLLKSDCTFPMLLGTIQEMLAQAPEFVVVEAGKTPTAASGASNGGSQRNGNHNGDHIDMASDATAAPAAATKKRVDFLKEALAMIPKIREHSMGYIKAPDSEASRTHLSGLQQRVHLLNTSAAQADCTRVAMLTSAFDALLSGIMDKPATVTPSVLQTIAQAVDCLDGLLKNNDGYSVGPPFQAKVLVVDDDTVCNHVNVTSLKRASFDAVGVKEPAAALSLLETTAFDLVVLDVNMPGMTGFDVCEKMRRLPHCKKTPVVFVTAFSNFDNRKQSVLSGGNDFVSKPVSPLELALKVTVNLIKARVQGVRLTPPETPSVANNGSADTPQPTTSTRMNQPAKAEAQPSQPPNRLAPTTGLGARDTKVPGTPLKMAHPEAEPRPASTPEPTPQSKMQTQTDQRSNNEPQSAEIHERLRQSTAALEHAKANLEQESAERARIESQWREQLNAAKALVDQTGTVLKEKEARCSQLEKELAGLRQERNEFQAKLTTEQQAVAKSQQEIKDIKANLEKQSAERTRLESEWREQLNAAKTAAAQKETVLKEKETRCGQLEKELAGLQQARDEFQNQFVAEKQAAAKAQQMANELQERLQQSNAEMGRTKADLEKQVAERTRLETEWRAQLNAAKAVASQAETMFSEKEVRCGQLEKELGGLRQIQDELQNKFAAEQQAVAKSQQETKELQERLRQGSAELERTKNAWEQESAKRAHLESECQNLTQAREALNLELRGLRESQAARETEWQDKQRKFTEGLRESIQLLQLKLQEAENFNGDPGEAARGKIKPH